MKKLVAFLLFCLCLSPAYSQSVLLHGPSYHSNAPTHYNNNNYGIGYVTENNIVLGAYRNSYYDNSAYMGYIWRYNQYFSISFALASGYYDAAIKPIVLPTLSIPIVDRVYLGLSVAPMRYTDTKTLGILTHSHLEYRF